MIGKYLQMFFYVLLYFGFVSVVGISIADSSAADSTMLIFMLVSFVLFVPLFIFIGNRVFSWKAETSHAISVKEIEKRLSEFTVNGLTFSYEAKSGTYLLSPFEYTMDMMNQKGRVKFYLKIWLDEKNKRARFCDYLVASTREHALMPNYFSFAKVYKKGMISLSTSAMSSDGSSFHFSTGAVHDEIIHLFTKNGWALQGKIL